MITREILELICAKLRSVIIYMILIGLLFFALGVAILFYPQVLTYLFVLSFYAIAFLSFLIAIKISHIKENFDKLLAVLPNKGRRRRKK